MRKPTRYALLALVFVLCAMGAAFYLRAKAPPEVALLLPESDAIVFFNLKPVRAATHFDQTPSARSPSFQQFINSTGIIVERDLDSAAFALHRMPNPAGPNGQVAFSEVFQGRFDSARLTHYLASLASSQESYAGHIIYSVPSQGRTLRVTQLGSDLVAASNMPTAEQIHSMLDRHRSASSATFSASAGPSLLSARFGDVPAFSNAWAIGQLALPFSNQGHLAAFGLTLPLPVDGTFVASLRFTGALNLRIDQITSSEAEAGQSVRSLTTLLLLLRNFQPVPKTSEDLALKQSIDSVAIQQHGNRAVLTAVLPTAAFKHLNALQVAAP